MKKILILLMLITLFSFGASTVYAEEITEQPIETEIIPNETPIEETPIEETPVEDEEIGTETETAPEDSSTVKDIITDEDSPANVWIEENILPYLGIAIGSAGGTSAVILLLSWIIKKILKSVTDKLEESYKKKQSAEDDEQSLKDKMELFSKKFETVVETLQLTFSNETNAYKTALDSELSTMKEMFESEAMQMHKAFTAFLSKYEELKGEVDQLYKALVNMTASNDKLTAEVSQDTKATLQKMANLTKETESKIDKEHRAITDILTIAFTNDKNLVANGYATEIKKVVQNNNAKKI